MIHNPSSDHLPPSRECRPRLGYAIAKGKLQHTINDDPVYISQ